MSSVLRLLFFFLVQSLIPGSKSTTIAPGIILTNYSGYEDYFYDDPGNGPSISFSVSGGIEHPLAFDFKDLLFQNNSSDTKKPNVIEVSDNILNNLRSATDLESIATLLGIKDGGKLEAEFYAAEKTYETSEVQLRSSHSDRFLTNPQQAHCEPELKAVDLELEENNAIIYYPSCVRVKRCGGCCHKKELFSCQPTASEKVLVKVMKLIPESNKENEIPSRRRSQTRSRRRRTSIEYNTFIATVEEHTECECQCTLKESACDLSVHSYNPDTCACICRNRDEEFKCLQTNTHIWNKKSCKCLCRNVVPCSSNESFDHTICRCISDVHEISIDNLYARSAAGGSPVRSLRNRKPALVPLA